MRGRTAIGLALLVLSGAAEAQWPQHGADAARSGVTRVEAPDWPDVSYRIDLGQEWVDGPLIDGPLAYVVVARQGDARLEPTLYEINIEAGMARRLATFADTWIWGFALDAERAYLVGEVATYAIDRSDGSQAWAAPHPAVGPTDDGARPLRCGRPAILDVMLYVACAPLRPTSFEVGPDGFVVGGSKVGEDSSLVFALESGDGSIGWATLLAHDLLWDAVGVSVIDQLVVVAYERLFRETSTSNPFGSSSGTFPLQGVQSARILTFAAADGRPGWGANASRELGTSFEFHPPHAVGGSNLVAFKLTPGSMRVFNAARGEELWNMSLGEQDVRVDDTGGGFAFMGDTIYATSREGLFDIDVVAKEPRWRYNVTVPNGDNWTEAPIAITPTKALAVSGQRNGRATLHAISREDASPMWTREFSQAIRFGVGEDVVLVADRLGDVYAIGNTNASMRVALDATQSYPRVGETVRVSLRNSTAGVAGAPQSFRATWGDGSIDEWTEIPEFTHRYEGAGDHVARFEVRNTQRYTASATMTFRVGASPPIIEEGEFPWWIVLALGIALATGGGAAAIFARRRRSAPDEQPASGRTFLGKYHIEREIGRGAFGAVWLARDVRIDRLVVIKQLHPELAMVDDVRARFRREARILGGLDHPNIVRMHAVEETAHAWFLVMEHVSGGSLREYSLPLRAPEATRVIDGMLSGLSYLHARGVMHRDLKPSNVLLSADGRPEIADFGVARSKMVQSTMLTASGSPGTPMYMAPEQVEGQSEDVRSDLYAVTAIAHEVLTGRFYLEPVPQDEYRLKRAIVESPPAIPKSLPGPIRAWLARGLAKDPAERFQTADEMRAALPPLHPSSDST